MKLVTEPYLTQMQRWPKTGRHIMAQFDDNSIVVYQGYSPEIGHFAASHGYFGGEFNLNRTSWIKTNFFWMMYGSKWGKKPGQEVILAVRIKRVAFNQILASAVHSSFAQEVYAGEKEWQQAMARSPVLLQWEKEHHPSGATMARQAIHLGLRGRALLEYAIDWIVSIEDISEFVQQQYQYFKAGDCTKLLAPTEFVYPVTSSAIAKRLELSVSY